MAADVDNAFDGPWAGRPTNVVSTFRHLLESCACEALLSRVSVYRGRIDEPAEAKHVVGRVHVPIGQGGTDTRGRNDVMAVAFQQNALDCISMLDTHSLE